LAVTTADFPTWTVTLVDQDSTPRREDLDLVGARLDALAS